MTLLLATWGTAFALMVLFVAVGILDRILTDRTALRDGRLRVLLADHVAGDRTGVRLEVERWMRGRPVVFLEMVEALAGGSRLLVRSVVEEIGLADRVRAGARASSWRRRSRAAQLLALLPGEDDAWVRLLVDRRPEVRAGALDSLGAGATARYAPIVVAACDDPHPATRFAAREALGRSDHRVVPHLVAALRRAAAGSVGEEGVRALLEAAAATPSTEIVSEVAAHDWPDGVHAEVVAVLSSGLAPRAVDRLVGFLDDDDPEVRAAATDALGRIGRPDVAPALGERLADRSWVVRRAAGTALAQLGPTGTLVLRRATRGDDRFARDMAEQVLRRSAIGRGVAA